MTELEEITHLIDVLVAKGTQGTREQCELRVRLILTLDQARQFHSPTLGATPVSPPDRLCKVISRVSSLLGLPDD